jgi:hypothetical protein
MAMMTSHSLRRRQEIPLLLMFSMLFSFLVVAPTPARAGFFSAIKNIFTVGVSLMAGLVGGGIGLAVGGIPGMLIGGIGASLVTFGMLNWVGSHLPELTGAAVGAAIGSRFGFLGGVAGAIIGAIVGDKISDAAGNRRRKKADASTTYTPPDDSIYAPNRIPNQDSLRIGDSSAELPISPFGGETSVLLNP